MIKTFNLKIQFSTASKTESYISSHNDLMLNYQNS